MSAIDTRIRKLEGQLRPTAPQAPTPAVLQRARTRWHVLVDAYEAVHGPCDPQMSLAEQVAWSLGMEMSAFKRALGMRPH